MKQEDEWFQDEGLWDAFAPVMFGPDRWAEVPSVADGVERLSGVRPSEGRLLDLCCGPGRVATEFARRGWRVTGVDLSPSYLDAAVDSAADEGLSIEYLLKDVREFRRPLSFDVATNLYISFGYFDDPADDVLFLRNARDSLVPGGVFIVETLGKETAARDFTAGETFERGGVRVRTEFSVVGAWEALRHRWIGTDAGGRTVDRSFSIRLYAGTELRSLLLACGFSGVDLYGEWDGRPYGEKARMLIAVARA